MIKINNFHVKDISTPKNGYTVYKDRWWACFGDEKKAIFYGNSPQCNSSKEIAQHVTNGYKDELEKHYEEEVNFVFVPIAYVKRS